MLTATQRIALMVLCAAMLCLFTIRWYWAQWNPPSITLHFIPVVQNPILNATTNSENTAVWDTFNPNTVSAARLIKMGMHPKTASTITHFREKGGRFNAGTDLYKIYGIDSQWVQKAQAYIILYGTHITPTAKLSYTQQPKTKQTALHIELNSCDSIALLQLPEIGPAFAHRILKYRNLLGGFTSTLQLLEVYGFSSEKFKALQHMIYVNALAIKKLNVNTDDFKTINRHPYISYELTKLIFDWKRKTLLTPENTRELINDNALWIKLKPYLQF